VNEKDHRLTRIIRVSNESNLRGQENRTVKGEVGDNSYKRGKGGGSGDVVMASQGWSRKTARGGTTERLTGNDELLGGAVKGAEASQTDKATSIKIGVPPKTKKRQ